MERRLIDPRIDLPTIDKYWESSVVPSLTEYIRILNLSPMFDADWASGGLMGDAVELVSQWIAAAQVPDLTTAKALTASMAHLLVTWPVQIENQQQGT